MYTLAIALGCRAEQGDYAWASRVQRTFGCYDSSLLLNLPSVKLWEEGIIEVVGRDGLVYSREV